VSPNLCEIELAAMVDAKPQRIVGNVEGRFALCRIGDAWAARIDAATLDTCRTLNSCAAKPASTRSGARVLCVACSTVQLATHSFVTNVEKDRISLA
jgi:hypothetical protein